MATQVMGLGGLHYNGLNRFSILGAFAEESIEGLGFRFDTAKRWTTPESVGLDHVHEALCPPYYPTMRAAVAAAIVEEAFFRRMIMDGVMASGGGPLVQILAFAVIFGVAHGIWGIVTGRPTVGIGVIIATGAVGAALAVVYLVGERSLAPPIISHFLITATIQPGITFAAFSGQMRKY